VAGEEQVHPTFVLAKKELAVCRDIAYNKAVDIQTTFVSQSQAAREAQNGYNYKGIQQLKLNSNEENF
jgi:hypothetical protein